MQLFVCEATPLHFVRVTSNQHVFINWALCWTLTHIFLIDEFDDIIYFPLLKHVHVRIFIFPQCKFSKCLCFFNCICTAQVVLFILGVFQGFKDCNEVDYNIIKVYFLKIISGLGFCALRHLLERMDSSCSMGIHCSKWQ